MTRVQKRIIFICVAISVVTLAAQWSGLSRFLDSLIGIHWSAGLVDFWKANTQGMVILVLLALFLEFAGLDRPRDRDRQESQALYNLLARTLATSPGLALTKRHIAEQFGERAADQLTRLLDQHSPVLKEVTVRVDVKRLPSQAFDVSVTLTYETKIPRYIVALTDDPLRTETLLSTGKLTEIFTIQKSKDDDWTPDDLPITVDRISASEGTSEDLGQLVFRKLSTKQTAVLLGQAGIRNHFERFHLFEGVVDGAPRPTSGSVEKYRVVYRTTQSPEFPYTFWGSDRVLHLKSVEIDLSDLGVDTYQNARIHFFLGTLRWSADVRQSDGVWSFPVDTWLVNGQGLMVFWPDCRASNASTLNSSKGNIPT